MEDLSSELKNLTESIQRLKSELITHFDSKFDAVVSRLDQMDIAFSTMDERADQLEQRVGANENNLDDVSTRVKQLEEHNSYLLGKVDDLENRSRSCNLRLIKVPESSENNDILGFVARLIQQVLGRDNFPSLPAIERAHRIPITSRSESSAPRPILIKLANFQDKIKILRLSRTKKTAGVQWDSGIFLSRLQRRLDEKAISFWPSKTKTTGAEPEVRIAVSFKADCLGWWQRTALYWS